jgi:hypothetical protein
MAIAGGRTLPLRSDTDGAILISLPEEAVSVTLEFREPARKRLSILGSAIVWVSVVGVLMLLPFRRSRGRVSDSNEIADIRDQNG